MEGHKGGAAAPELEALFVDIHPRYTGRLDRSLQHPPFQHLVPLCECLLQLLLPLLQLSTFVMCSITNASKHSLSM